MTERRWNSFKCVVCDEDHSSLSGLLLHISLVHNVLCYGGKCVVCFEDYWRGDASYSWHLLSQHDKVSFDKSVALRMLGT